MTSRRCTLRRQAALALVLAALSACATTNRAGAHRTAGDGGGLQGLDTQASGTPTPGGAASGTPAPGASAVPTATAGATASSGTGGGSTGGAATGGSTTSGVPVVNGPGVTATTVKIGFIVVKGGSSYGNGAAFKSPDYGDVPKQVQTLVDWVNARGGVAGRKVIPVVRLHDINNDSRTTEEDICTGFTQDDKVFAVVLQAQGYPETRRCYASHKTLVLDPTAFLYGSDSFRALAPYYWSPNYVNYSRVMRVLVPALKAQAFFGAGYKLGVVTYDVDVYHAIVDHDLRPALQANGIALDPNNVKYLRNTDIPTIQQDATTAVGQLQIAGVNRVVFAGLGPYAPLFMSTAEGAAYRPRYGITSYDQPRFDQNWKAMNPAAQLKGAVGIGFSPTQDVSDAQYPFPAANERTCLGVYAAKGITFAERADSGYALSYCDSLVMLQRAAAGLTGLTASSWGRRVPALGTSFQSAIAFGTLFGPGRMDGGNGYRYLWFDDGCACMRYRGGTHSIG